MLQIKDRSVSIMVLCCIALHLWWAIVISFDQSGIGGTGIEALYRWLGGALVPWLFLVAILAAVASIVRGHWWIALLLIPQEITLMASASGAANAIWLSQFADGVFRSRSFIANDQAWTIIGAIGHTLAIVAIANNGRRCCRDA